MYICPANKIPHDDGQAGQRRGDALLLSDKSARLSLLPRSRHNAVQGVRPQNPAQHLRGSARRCWAPGKTEAFKQSGRDRKRVEMLFAHLENILRTRPAAIARAMRCSVRVHVGSDRTERPQACQVGRPATTVRPFVRCVSVASVSKVERT